MDDMNERMSALEEDLSTLKSDLAALKTDVAVIRSNYVTKADLIELEASLLQWYIGSFFTMAGLLIAAVRFLR